jgi:hypothetical protein
VNGNLTATTALLARVTDLTVSGSLDADDATYSKVTKLTVNSEFEVDVPLPALEDLIVTTGGVFTSTSTIGTVDSENGIGLEIAPASSTIPAGSVTVTQINSLRTSTIQGALTATGFTLYAPTPALTTPSELKVAAKGSINGITFPGQVVITALNGVNSVTIDDFTVPEDLGLTIPALKTLVIGAGKTFTYDGQVIITATGNLVLATSSTSSVGKIAGTGSIIAGLTTIRGAWEATATGANAGTLTIGSTANGATIATDATNATGLKASVAGATITQGAGTGNNLSIGASTIIDLAGTATAAAGKLIVTGAASGPGKVTLTATTSTIQIGTTFTANTAFGTAAKIGGKTFGAGSNIGYFTSTTNAAGKFMGLKGTAANATFLGGDASNTIEIDSTQDVTT